MLINYQIRRLKPRQRRSVENLRDQPSAIITGCVTGPFEEIVSEWVWDGGNKVTLRWRSSYLDKRHNKRNCLFTVMVRKNRVGRCVKEWTISFVKMCVLCMFTLIGSWEGGKNFRVGIYLNKILLGTRNKQLFLGLIEDV